VIAPTALMLTEESIPNYYKDAPGKVKGYAIFEIM